MHLQNIMFVFLPLLKLVVEATGKVKDFLLMQVSIRHVQIFIFTIWVTFGNLTGEFRFLNRSSSF